MVTPNHAFPRAEHEGRLARAQSALRAAGQDARLAFMPQSVTCPTGFFTRGCTSLQMAIVPAKGAPCIVCRDVSAYHLDATSVFPDPPPSSDGDRPVDVAAAAMRARLGAAPRLAVGMAAWPLSVARRQAPTAGLPGATFEDAGRLVTDLRLVKSPAEIAYQRRAARAAKAGMQAALDAVAPGISERARAMAICAAMIRAGSDLPGPGVLSSGERACRLHGGCSDRVLAPSDIVQTETTPAVRNLHARFLRPARVSRASDEGHRTVERLIAIQDAALAAVRPELPARAAAAIVREGVLSAGLRETFTNPTFHSLGLPPAPSGGAPREAHPGAAGTFAEDMVFYACVPARGFGMAETIAVNAGGIERLTTFPRRLFVL